MRGFIKARPLFCMCLCGAVSAFVCSFLKSGMIFACFCALLFSMLFVLPQKFELRRTVLLMLAFSAVMALSFFVYYKFSYERACRLNGQTLTADCTVISQSSRTLGGSLAIDVKINEITGGASDLPAGCKVRLYYDDGGELELVPSAKIKAEFNVFETQDNDKFDSDGVHISAYVTKLSVTLPYDSGALSHQFFKIRNFAADRINFNDADASAFIKGMILGDKSEISAVFLNKFSEIGMSHVMSVSGMHLMFAVLFFEFILSVFGVGYKLRSVFSFVAAALFLVLSGFSVSCIRSAVMISVMYGGRLFNRFSDSLTSLLFAVFVILLMSPYNIRNPSFLLSVCATLGIIVFARIFNFARLFKIKNSVVKRIVNAVFGSVSVSLSACVGCLPVFVLMFGKVNLLSPLSNLLLILPVQLMFYMGFAAVLFPFLASFAGAVVSVLYKFVSYVTDFEYGLKYTSVTAEYEYFYPVFAVLAVLVIGIFVYNARLPEKRVYPFVLGYAVICCLLFGVNFIFSRDTVTVDFVDVGQGSCTVFSKDEHAVIVDCGGEYSDRLIETLRYRSVKRIELVALTHTDLDHIKYLDYLINSYEIDKIIYPNFADDAKIERSLSRAAENGTQVYVLEDDVSFSVLNGAELSAFVSIADRLISDTNVSALYKLSFAESSVVCPGDMDVYEERLYLDYGDALDCDILLAAHHGANGSSLAWILELYSPRYSVISVGRDNGYGHPGKKALARLEAVSEVLRTDERGTITFRLDKKGYRLS